MIFALHVVVNCGIMASTWISKGFGLKTSVLSMNDFRYYLSVKSCRVIKSAVIALHRVPVLAGN